MPERLQAEDLIGLERRKAAELVHEFLRKELGEADEENWSAAGKLRDLYDCHICVNHVAQVYVKGIMEAFEAEPLRFGMRELVGEAEAGEILARVLDPGRRRPKSEERGTRKVVKMSRAEALALLKQLPEAILIDVRTASAFADKPFPGAKNLPMAEILKNPYQVSDRLDLPLFFCCEEGYQSEVAANCAAEAGYGAVYYFGE